MFKCVVFVGGWVIRNGFKIDMMCGCILDVDMYLFFIVSIVFCSDIYYWGMVVIIYNIKEKYCVLNEVCGNDVDLMNLYLF